MDALQYSPIYDEKTRQTLEQQFSRLNGECYVDHAGATLYSDNQIKKSLDDLLLSLYINPHSSGVNGNLTEEAIDNVRYIILDHFHTNQEEYSVIFTSGATASLKLVAEAFNFRNEKHESNEKPGNFVYIQDNHTSVLGMRDITAQRGANVVCLNHDDAFEILQQSTNRNHSTKDKINNSLFVYSAQCNFSGLKYPLDWIENIKNGCLDAHVRSESNWFTLLDAAGFVATNDLNLSIFKPDFVCLSFYKLFGYPTGIGALLVKNDRADVLKKVYYGGGTVNVVLSSKMHHVKRESLHEKFEDGTISFLTIIPLHYGFKILSDLTMERISAHVYSLAKYLHHSLLTLHHQNGAPVIKLYCDTDYEDRKLQGGIVAFNVLRANGECIGYMEVLHMAALYKIHLRTGCFCNPGACQRHLNLSDEEILKNYDSGYTCGGTKDLIDGRPTGAVRISFGYMSTINDVNTILQMLKRCFISGKPLKIYPSWWSDFKLKSAKKYSVGNIKQSKTSTIFHNVKKGKAIDVMNGDNPQNQALTILINNSKILINKDKSHFTLSRAFIYPIKSCGAYEIEHSWKITFKGLQYDREWMIVNSKGVCLTQKQETKLCLITPIIDLKNNVLKLNYPGMPPIDITLDIFSQKNTTNKVCRGRVCGHKVEGTDCGAEASEWLSLALGRPNLRLIRQSDSNHLKRTDKPELSFASQSQYLLINESSILWLADKISEDSECDKSTMLQRFRGNFIVRGGAPFEETRWKSVQIGNCLFEIQGICTRCQMICIDQTTAKRTVEPLRTLAEEFHGKLRFGIYLSNKSHENEVLNISDQVSVT